MDYLTLDPSLIRDIAMLRNYLEQEFARVKHPVLLHFDLKPFRVMGVSLDQNNISFSTFLDIFVDSCKLKFENFDSADQLLRSKGFKMPGEDD